jgi:NTE family protein
MKSCSRHAARKYLPDPDRQEGVALCLSGEGLRAALFHVGVLKRLNECGLLSKVRTISAVGGGSILAGTLIANWAALVTDERCRMSRLDDLVSEPVIQLTAKPLSLRGVWWDRLRPSNWAKIRSGDYGSTDRLAAFLDHKLLRGVLLRNLPKEPQLVLTATNLRTGGTWEFRPDRVGEALLGNAPPQRLRLSQAVAAALAPPAELPPLQLYFEPDAFDGGALGPKANMLRRVVSLADGCLSDPLAVEPVWRSCAILVCSDAGTRFSLAANYRDWLGNRLVRSWEIAKAALLDVKKRWLIAGLAGGALRGVYIGLSAYHGNYGLAGSIGYPRDVVEEIGRTRTELSVFTLREIMTLVNHGYTLADAGLRRYLVDPATAPPLHLPYPDFVDRTKVLEALEERDRRAA